MGIFGVWQGDGDYKMNHLKFFLIVLFLSFLDLVLPAFGWHYNFIALIFILGFFLWNSTSLGTVFAGVLLLEITHGYNLGNILLPFSLCVVLFFALNRSLNISEIFRPEDRIRDIAVFGAGSFIALLIFLAFNFSIQKFIFGNGAEYNSLGLLFENPFWILTVVDQSLLTGVFYGLLFSRKSQ